MSKKNKDDWKTNPSYREDFSIDAPKAPSPLQDNKPQPPPKPPAKDEFEEVGDDDIVLYEEDVSDDPEAMAWAKEQEEIKDIARHILSGRDEVLPVLDRVSDVDISGSLAASLLIETMQGKIADDRLDNMLITNFLLRADNIDEISGEFGPRVQKISDEFRALDPAASRTDRLKQLEGMSVETKNLFLVSVVAETTVHQIRIAKGLDEAPKEDSFYKNQADMVVRLSKISGMNSELLDHAVEAFNLLAGVSGSPVALVRNADGTARMMDGKNLGGVPKPRRPGPGGP